MPYQLACAVPYDLRWSGSSQQCVRDQVCRFCDASSIFNPVPKPPNQSSQRSSQRRPQHPPHRLYNDRHPRGRKSRPEELRLHKQQWLRVCETSPGELLAPALSQDVGPIQALVDELEFNIEIAGRLDPNEMGALFLVSQFESAITEGVFSLLRDSLVPQMVETLGRNLAHQEGDLALFEIGRAFWKESGAEAIREEDRLCLGLMGKVGRVGLDVRRPAEAEEPDQGDPLGRSATTANVSVSASFRARCAEVAERGKGRDGPSQERPGPSHEP